MHRLSLDIRLSSTIAYPQSGKCTLVNRRQGLTLKRRKLMVKMLITVMMIGLTYGLAGVCVGQTPTPVGCSYHTADQNGDWQIDFNLALLLVSRFNTNGGVYSCGAQADGYQAGSGSHACGPHKTDYNGNWVLDFTEMLRFIQLFNMGYHCQNGSVDGYGAGWPGMSTNTPTSSALSPTHTPSRTCTPTENPAIPVLRFNPSGGEFATAGGNFSLQIIVDTNGETNARMAFGFIYYAADTIRFVTGTINTTVFNNAGFTNPYVRENEPGILSFSAASLNAINNDTVVGTLTFTAISPGPADLVWLSQNPHRTELTDDNFNDLPVRGDSGSYTITPDAAVRPNGRP